MVGNLPAVCQVDIFLKLNRDHFWVRLHNHTLEPIPYPSSLFVFMITKHFYNISHLEDFIPFRGTCKS